VKFNFFIKVSILLCFTACVNQKHIVHGQKSTINFSKDEKHTLDTSLDDFLIHFRDCVSKDVFTNTNIVLTDNSEYVPNEVARALENSRQSFYIDVNENQLLIYGHFSEGIRNGLYWYLDKLGMKWYFPGEIWKIYPDKHKQLLAKKGLIKPSIGNRSFFGGGGFPRNFPGDPENIVKSEWKIWMDRNLWGNETKGIGHAWQDFIRRNKDVLSKNPQFLASPLKIDKPKLSTKLCVGNPGLVKLFIKDREALLREKINRFGKDHLNAQSIGVEPSDGSGFCDCEACRKIGNISDQVFYLANKVAEHLEKAYPNVKIALLAYNQHTAVPNIDLHKNLYVTLVPWRFQHETFADNIVKDWKAKFDNIEIYYYWSLLVTTKGKPLNKFLDIPQKEIDFLNKYNVDGFRIETTYSIGAVGIPLYLLSQISFDNSKKQDDLLDNLLTDCFGKGKLDMERIFRRWSENGFIPSFEKYLVFDDFRKAKRNADNDLDVKRIEEFEKYASFLFYADDVKSSRNDSTKLDKSLDNLIDFSYSILPSLMVHSYWLSSPFMRTYNMDRYKRGGRSRELHKPAQYWKNLKTIPHPYSKLNQNKNSKLVNKLMEDKKSKVRSIDRRRSLVRSTEIPKNALKIRSQRGFNFTVEVDARKKIDLSFQAKKISPKRFGTMVGISVYNDRGEQIDVQIFKEGGNKSTQIYLPEKGRYKIYWKLTNVKFSLDWMAPENLIIECGTPISLGRYAYNIEGQDKLLVSSRRFKVLNTSGKSITKEKIEDGLFLVDLSKVSGDKIYFESDRIVKILNSDHCEFFIDN